MGSYISQRTHCLWKHQAVPTWLPFSHLGVMLSKAPLIQKSKWIVRWVTAKEDDMSHAVGQTYMALERYCLFPEWGHVCVSGMPKSQREFTTFPGMPGVLAEVLHEIAVFYPKRKKKKSKTKQTPGTVQNSKAHNPLPQRNEAQAKSSRHKYRARHPQAATCTP